MCLTLSDTDSMNSKYYGNCKVYVKSESLWKNLDEQGVIYTGIHKSKYYRADFSWYIKIKFKGDNIETMYNIIPYKSKVVYVEYQILNVSPIRQNINNYPRKEKNCGDDSNMVILDNGSLCDTTISGNIDSVSNTIPEST